MHRSFVNYVTLLAFHGSVNLIHNYLGCLFNLPCMKRGDPQLNLNDLRIFFCLYFYSVGELPLEGGKVTGLFCPLLFKVE